jgi:hypothetical protein
VSGKKNPPKPPSPRPAKTAPPAAGPPEKSERRSAKQVAAARAKLQKAMQDPEFRARVVQQIKGLLRDE